MAFDQRMPDNLKVIRKRVESKLHRTRLDFSFLCMGKTLNWVEAI